MYTEKTDINKVVGKEDANTIVVCNYLFRHDDGMQGATGSRFRPVTADEYEDALDPRSEQVRDHLYELWKESVYAERTEDSFQDFCEEVIAIDGAEAMFDMSYSDCWDVIREAYPEYADEDEYPIFDCVGGGRCFTPDMAWHDLHDPALWETIKQYETN